MTTPVLSIHDLAYAELPPVSVDDVVTWVDVGSDPASVVRAAANARRSHRLVIGVGSASPTADPLVDAMIFTLVSSVSGDRRTVQVDSLSAAVEHLDAAVRAKPIAATTLAGLLSLAESLDVHDALIAESLAYSTLQGGPEYARWLAAADYRFSPENGGTIAVDRVGDELIIVLDRPERHNALDAEMRDALVEALQVAVADDSVTRVVLSGRGRSFCSGGDLAEFGTTSDPATAHLIRTQHRPGEQLHELAARLGSLCTARVHGAVMGGGLEIAAFCGHVVAEPESAFLLPEMSMGLVPGAGGTVSVARRIGRWRTGWMVLSGETVTADRALDWGLIDEVSNTSR